MIGMRSKLGSAFVLAVVVAAGCKSTCCAPMVNRGGAATGQDQDGVPRKYAAPPSAFASIAPTPISEPVQGHPRLWLRAEDLPRLRSWAVAGNPVWERGLKVVAAQAVADMDAGRVPAAGMCAPESRFCEQYALLFAFLSLVSPDATARQDYAKRARDVLMHMMNRVVAAAADDPLAAERFAIQDRSRWAGEAFGLTVDWIYPVLTDQDKATIRKVFLKWCEQQLHAQVTGHNHPEPVGMLNDPELVKDKSARRYAANNYYTAHMRNLVLMSLALDDRDDPEEPGGGRTYPRLRDYLRNGIGAWLYATDHVLNNDAQGGTAPEGFEYAPRTLGFVMQTYWALETAGQADPARFGSQVLWENNPFWRQVPPAFLHGLSPARVELPERGGKAFSPAWFGDGERSWLLDFVDVFAPMGMSARLHGDAKLLDTTRWIQLHTPVGGEQDLLRRATALNGAVGYRESILYFMLFDPAAPKPAAPYAGVPLTHFGSGLNQVFSRTGWTPEASWFTYQLAWESIDHQHGDANTFALYRKGEWLTKERVGYGYNFDNSDQHNTLAVENDKPYHPDDERRGSYWRRGSQWVLGTAADPRLIAKSLQDDFVYVFGDATGVYNSTYEGIDDVKHVSRSLVWMKPDHIVVYDRAETGNPDHFKRFWLQIERPAKVEGMLATATTSRGQQLFVRTLLPEGARIQAIPYEGGGKWPTQPATYEPMLASIRVESATPGRNVRFMHVLQGADGGAKPDAATLVRCDTGACEGAAVGAFACIFPVNPEQLGEVTVRLPASVTKVIVTGLAPGASYDATKTPTGGQVEVKIRKGQGSQADEGGVLRL